MLAEDAAETTMELTADATSLRVRKGTGGMQALGDEDKDNIHQTIDDEVLERQDIVFRSTSVSGERRAAEGGGRPHAGGHVHAGRVRPGRGRRRGARADRRRWTRPTGA